MAVILTNAESVMPVDADVVVMVLGIVMREVVVLVDRIALPPRDTEV